VGSRCVVGCVVLVAALSGGACTRSGPKARFADGVFTRGDERFRVVPPPTGWIRLSVPGGDVAWTDEEHRAVMGANASCRGHGDPPLETLVNDLLIGTTSRHYLLEERVPLDGREAKHAVVSLQLDGVPLVYDVYVIKKDGCVYDLTLVTQPRAYDLVADDFVRFVAGFHGLGSGERVEAQR
jgi:hypothetical protein